MYRQVPCAFLHGFQFGARSRCTREQAPRYCAFCMVFNLVLDLDIQTSGQILCILHGFQLGIRSRHTDKRPNTVHFAWFSTWY